MRLLAPQLVDQHLATCSGEDSTDHVGVDDVREGVALFGEMTDVIPDGLAALLIAALEVPRVAWVDVCALELANKPLPQVCPATNRMGRQELEPGANVVSQTNG